MPSFSLEFLLRLLRNEPYAARPNKAPTPAVKAIAKAPQTVTRTAAVSIEAPPTLAAMDPRTARKISEQLETLHISAVTGNKRTIESGKAAPTANVTADAIAAWIGRAVIV